MTSLFAGVDPANVCDFHQHQWNQNLSWWHAAPAELQRDFGPAEVAKAMASVGVSQAVVVQAEDFPDGHGRREAEWFRASRTSHPWIKGAIVSVDLAAGPDVVEPYLDQLCDLDQFVVGVRVLHTQEDATVRFLTPEFISAVNLLPLYGLTLDFLARDEVPEQSKGFESFLQQIDDYVPVMANHGLKPLGIECGAPTRGWAKRMGRIATRHSKLYMKVSGLTGLASPGTPQENVLPFLDVLLEAFGPDRLVWGSDYPVSSLVGTYADSVAYLAQWIESRGLQQHAGGFFGSNGAAFYDIG